MVAIQGNFAKSGQKSCMCQFPCFTALLCLRERSYPWSWSHRHRHMLNPGTHVPSCLRLVLPCDATSIRWCCWLRLQLVLLPGDFTASHTFLELMFVSLLSRQYLGKGAAENQPKEKIMTHVQLETLPDSVCHRSLLLVTVQGRLWTCASLVPFGDSVKLDLCTWNPRLVHTGQT